jgi:tRNA pseudouridine38-40 synthase
VALLQYRCAEEFVISPRAKVLPSAHSRMSQTTTNWRLILTYDGAPFHGWQVQPGYATVQGVLAGTIERITGERVLPQGSGRTDAGVHALGQVASFELQAQIPAGNLLRALNRALPASIHARHSARRKTYEYRIFERRISSAEGSRLERICSPFLAPYVWDCRWPLDLAAMQRAAESLVGTNDFTSFAATDPDLQQRNAGEDGAPQSAPHPVKTIFASTAAREGDLLVYRVRGSGFLHHMVRNLAGTLVEIGRGSMRADAIPAILAARDRSAAGPTAPAQGLFLLSVAYDDTASTTQATDGEQAQTAQVRR